MEWETDRYGKRFRMVGNVKEYEMMILVDGGREIPESELEAYNASKKTIAAPEPEKYLGSCPFNRGINIDCRSDCALYTDKGCKFITKTLKTDTAGKHCPFSSYSCTKNCRLYDEGCLI